MKVASRLVDKSLEEFPGKAEAKRAGHILRALDFRNQLLGKSIEPAPNQDRAPAEIDDTSRKTFIHRHISFAGERVARVEHRAVADDSLLVANSPPQRRAECDAAILNRMVRIDFEIPSAFKRKVRHGVAREQVQHVVEKRNPCPGPACALPVDIEAQTDAGLLRHAL